ncbi:hypothetical protein [Pantoea ananatis]|uniref:hypothetical protein n=3 Tax=Pantoea ananas TaxID=553 RepID=UPI001F2EE105|nr:hypothetical protein [Pantoea ananatis]
MKRAMTALLPIILTTLVSNSALAQGVPLLGNLPASGHQLCGKTIRLQLVKNSDEMMILGIKNKQSNEMDLFMSSLPFTVSDTYARFIPVKFDQLSKTFIATHDDELDVIWGAALDDKNTLGYKLALGNFTYSCSAPEAWPNDKANHLYGEPPTDTHAASENVAAEKNAKTTKTVKPRG